MAVDNCVLIYQKVCYLILSSEIPALEQQGLLEIQIQEDMKDTAYSSVNQCGQRTYAGSTGSSTREACPTGKYSALIVGRSLTCFTGPVRPHREYINKSTGISWCHTSWQYYANISSKSLHFSRYYSRYSSDMISNMISLMKMAKGQILYEFTYDLIHVNIWIYRWFNICEYSKYEIHEFTYE